MHDLVIRNGSVVDGSGALRLPFERLGSLGVGALEPMDEMLIVHLRSALLAGLGSVGAYIRKRRAA